MRGGRGKRGENIGEHRKAQGRKRGIRRRDVWRAKNRIGERREGGEKGKKTWENLKEGKGKEEGNEEMSGGLRVKRCGGVCREGTEEDEKSGGLRIGWRGSI